MKYKYIVAIATGISMLSISCNKDFLDTKLNTEPTPETIATSAGSLTGFAWAFYTPIRDGFTAIDNDLFATISDEAQNNLPSNNAIYFNQGLLSESINPESSIYKSYYDGIRAANNFLDYSVNADRLILIGRDPVADAASIANDKQNIEWFKAEAHIAKAYYYAELIKRWGGVPIVTETLQKSGIVAIPKSTYDEVVEYIVKEIDDNKANLQVNWKTSAYAGNDGRFTLGAALAIKARVLLYAASPLHNPTNDIEKWKRAAAASYDLITTPGLNLALNQFYGSYFRGATPLTSSETIFAVRRSANNTMEKQNYPISTPGGIGEISPSDNLVADYEYNGTPSATDPYANRDSRLANAVVYNGSTWNSRVMDFSPGGTEDMNQSNGSKTGYYLKKFLNDNLNLVQNATVQHNWVVFRYAEVLLNYAEAMNEAYGADNNNGYTKTARQAINEVRARSNMPAINIAATTSKDGFRVAVKHERRIELAFEGHRYWDLLRWKDAETVLNQPIIGVKVTKVSSNVWTYQKINAATRKFDASKNYYYPFSRTEIVNSKGALVQNPGY
ncbi:RagB/SusD family nutrient uptake outer membrane protein [Pedobacter sp. SD-b]|uniref:RagB/SusD family nutrient uptake outer membrane protein n=1 Tax=Pedobacter segetis TaxID=2793069 RepID=A0ABS1BML1_9SPHI|nr:RagB/SusD family nutrient uptake outer membrane protein [Pedobacter segetis]MBK0384137.1 RagB/SusD family nutrient uptake outer membrane protein [Pedobacter segetis]